MPACITTKATQCGKRILALLLGLRRWKLALPIGVLKGAWFGLPDVGYPEPETSRAEALQRVIKHKDNIIHANPAEAQLFDEALRCALTKMMTDETCQPPSGSDVALRYLRDRINVPRDMSIYAAKRLRTALEETAALDGDRQSKPIPVRHRYDQNPAEFLSKSF